VPFDKLRAQDRTQGTAPPEFRKLFAAELDPGMTQLRATHPALRAVTNLVRGP
jgi:hypothetical protein